ncbi:MAG: 3-dehydroquinate synthase [Burkholderiaceae bacterium]
MDLRSAGSSELPQPVAGNAGVRQLQVSLGDRSYPIRIGTNLLGDEALWSTLLPSAASRKVALVTNDRVGPLYAKTLEQALSNLGCQISTIVLPDGEQHKTLEGFGKVIDGLMQARMERKSTLIALGGGVVGDMAGFAASCYQRGMPFIQVPTTLLAQVDSSVGGKTAVNHPLGKNMVGAFYQPQAVVIDLNTLSTLADQELSAGMAEVIKYGCIMDEAFFQWLETHVDGLMSRDPELLAQAVYRCCELKAKVVAMDERESGARALLNFGHTFGHAIESEMGYGQWLHGEAVGCGMRIASELSCQLGLIDISTKRRIERLIAAAGLPTQAPNWPAKAYLSAMAHDKKAESGEIRYVLLQAMGQAFVRPVDDQAVSQALEASQGPIELQD